MIRHATIRDLPFALRCWADSLDESPIPYRKAEEVLAFQTHLFVRVVSGEQKGGCLIAEDAGLIIGAGDPPALFDYGVFLLPECRDSGVGSALLAASEQWAKENGYTRMIGSPLIRNKGSRRWLQRAGYKPLQVVMVKEIG